MTTPKPRVSIILNSFMNKAKLSACLEAVKRDEYPNKELIVVTYGIDDSIFLEEVKGQVDKLVILDEDLGAASQRNMGFENRDLTSKYVLYVDDDVKVRVDTLSKLVEVVELNPDVTIAQPLLIDSHGKIDCCGMMIDQLGYSYYNLNGVEAEGLRFKEEIVPISYAVTACVLVNTASIMDAFNRPFDDSYYFNYEDVDFCLRNWIKDQTIACITTAQATHDRSRTANLGRSPENLVYLNTLNKFRTLFSVYDGWDVVRYIPLFILMELAKSIKLMGVNREHSKATFQAVSTIFNELGENINRRRRVQSEKKVSFMDKAVLRNFNIRELNTAFTHHYGDE